MKGHIYNFHKSIGVNQKQVVKINLDLFECDII